MVRHAARAGLTLRGGAAKRALKPRLRRGRKRTAHRLEAAKARLDTLDLYPEPVRLHGVRLWHAPWFFRIPGYRRYHGYAFRKTILVRTAEPSDDLVTHELCHIWQSQQRPFHHFWTWLTTPYGDNPYEREAREAVARTRT